VENVPHLDPQLRTEATGGVVGFRAVVIQKYGVVTAVAEQRSTELPDFRRRLYPTRSLQVEFSQLLQVTVLRFREERDAHLGSHVHGAGLGFMLFSGIKRGAIVANAAASFRTLRRAIVKDILAGLLVVPDNIRLATSTFHFIQGP